VSSELTEVVSGKRVQLLASEHRDGKQEAKKALEK
jgi:hypothetical protein